MQVTTLLTIFIGMVAVSWLLVALVVALIGWQVYKILIEVREGVAKVREAGEAALSDVQKFREAIKAEGSRIKNLLEFVAGLAIRKVATKRRRPKVEIDIEEDVAD